MNLLGFHHYLTQNECELQNFELNGEDFSHSIYKNLLTGRKASVPIDRSEVDDELVAMICGWLEVSVPHPVN